MTLQTPFIFLSIFLVFISSNGSASFAARLLLDPPKEQLHPPMPPKPEKPTFSKYEISPMLPKYEHPPKPAKPRHFPTRFSFPKSEAPSLPPKPEEPTFSLPQLTPKSELAPALPPSLHEQPALPKPRNPTFQFPPMPKFPKTVFPPKSKFHTSPKHELPPKFQWPFHRLQWPNTTWPKVHESPSKSAFPPLPQAMPKSQEPAQFHSLTKPEEQTLPAKSVFPPLPQAMPKSQEPAPSDQHQVSTQPKLEIPSSPEEKPTLPKPEIPSFHNPHPKIPKFQQQTIPKTALPPRSEGPNNQMPKPAKTEPALTPMTNWAALPPISTP